ncbi:hypothetical protein J6590_022396 [Homalodisca vitripennis]|nr:hypothetical protein J6590_022396 [Homalodisca vitripennis]
MEGWVRAEVRTLASRLCRHRSVSVRYHWQSSTSGRIKSNVTFLLSQIVQRPALWLNSSAAVDMKVNRTRSYVVTFYQHPRV